jgi:hypothetical protein
MAGFADHTILSYSPVRTAIGAFNGALNDTPAIKLGAPMMRDTHNQRLVRSAQTAEPV